MLCQEVNEGAGSSYDGVVQREGSILGRTQIKHRSKMCETKLFVLKGWGGKKAKQQSLVAPVLYTVLLRQGTDPSNLILSIFLQFREWLAACHWQSAWLYIFLQTFL